MSEQKNNKSANALRGDAAKNCTKSSLTIYTDRLEEGKREVIDLTLPPDFLEIAEEELVFTNPIFVKGEAYVITDHLVLELSIKTVAQIPCTICNKKTAVSLENQEIHYTSPLIELNTPNFNYTDLLREEIVVLIPQFVECGNGQCPERIHLSKFIKEKQHHFPFADL